MTDDDDTPPGIDAVEDPDGGQMWAVTLPEEMMEAFRREVEHQGVSVEQYVRGLIEAGFDDLKRFFDVIEGEFDGNG